MGRLFSEQQRVIQREERRTQRDLDREKHDLEKQEAKLVRKFTLFTLNLGPPVPLGASGDGKSPSISVTGDPAGSMPADTSISSRSYLKFICRSEFV